MEDCDLKSEPKHENPLNQTKPEKTADSTIEEEIISTVLNSSAIFKSQQKDDPDLSAEEKQKIAEDLLQRNHYQFLVKFGKFLRPHLLNYFVEKSSDYETTYHINKLRRYFNNETRQIDTKNRRYEALKELIEKGEYFSETEMMRRNPLLYDNLVGKYLTEEEKKARDNIDTQNITFLGILMEGIERDTIRDLKKSQQDAEHEVAEENDSDSEEESPLGGRSTDSEEEMCPAKEQMKRDGNWGEMNGEKEEKYEVEKRESRKQHFKVPEINFKEQQMLKQEFITQMYQSFLDGKDKDFDYSTVDDNEIYDNVDLREQDEEEKYFDSESPEVVDLKNEAENEEESEDELDKFMRSLKEAT